MSEAGLPGRVLARLDRLAELCGPRFLVGLSGGSDSTALMALALRWAQLRGHLRARSSGGVVSACVVDHGLRPGSADEAEAVAAHWRAAGAAVTIATWQRARGTGVTPPALGSQAQASQAQASQAQASQAQARAARHRLLAATARAQGAGVILLGHTADDQAETVALRLVRGTGPDGLTGMAQLAPSPEDALPGAPVLARPLLDLSREDLRDWLVTQGLDWLEDPSNHQRRFARVAVRQRLALLAQAGAAPDRLVAIAGHARQLRGAVDAEALQLARQAVVEGHQITVPLPVTLQTGPAAQRVTGWALGIIGQQPTETAPAGPIDPAQIASLLAQVRAGHAANLAGALVRPVTGGLRICPEPPRRVQAARLETAREPQAMAVLAGRWTQLLRTVQLALDMDQAHPPGGCA